MSWKDDVALARGCAAGDEAAWDRFVREYRPVLYRAADALDASGGAREVADSLYAELYGLKTRDGERQSLLRYYHGKSSLATWLRAVLSQRYIDQIRATRRLQPLPSDVETDGGTASDRSSPRLSAEQDADRSRYLDAVRAALGRAIARLDSHDRLRLGCYYVQGLTLAAIGRLFGEHEATASRKLTRLQRDLRGAIEQDLREEAGLQPEQISEAIATAGADSGPIDLQAFLETAERKKVAVGRSNE